MQQSLISLINHKAQAPVLLCDKYTSISAQTKASMSLEFLDTILNRLSKSTEKEAFAIQNTLYSICIILNAAVESDACYSQGFIAIDDKTYDTSGHIFPADLIADYGFWSGPDGYCKQTALDLFWTGTHIIMDKIEIGLQIKPEWNYYNAAESTAQLEGAWLERANALFSLTATAEEEEVDPIIRKQKVPYKHTRRVHGRRALTPPRSNRPTAITRSTSSKGRYASAGINSSDNTKSPHK